MTNYIFLINQNITTYISCNPLCYPRKLVLFAITIS